MPALRNRWLAHSRLLVPWFGGLDRLIHGLDVLDTVFREPVFQRFDAARGVYWNAFFPCCAAAQHARVICSGFSSHVQRLDKLLVAYTGAEINERLFCHACSPA